MDSSIIIIHGLLCCFPLCAPFHDVFHVSCLSSALHGLTALLCAEQLNFPPLLPFSITLCRTSPLLLSQPHFSQHLYSAPASSSHESWPLTMAYKSRFSFWEQKGSLFLFTVFFVCFFASSIFLAKCFVVFPR